MIFLDCRTRSSLQVGQGHESEETALFVYCSLSYEVVDEFKEDYACLNEDEE